MSNTATFKRLPRILLTNDDGFDAPGLAALREIAAQLSDEVWVVAPQLDQSGMGNSLSLNQALRATPRGERQWSVSGTPADCVIMGVSHLMQGNVPTVILSGVNAGSNIGDEVGLSGTLGAAFTGLMLGIPSIGISLDCASRKNVRWDTARALLPGVLKNLLTTGWRANTCLSINIPDMPSDKVKGYRWARSTAGNIGSFIVDKREDLREKDYYWIYPGDHAPKREPGTDLAVMEGGEIAVTCLTLDRSVATDLPPVAFADLPG